MSNAILGTENSIYFQMGSRGWLTPELPKFTDRPVQSVFCITDIQLELFKARRPASLVYLFINCPWCIWHRRYSIRFFGRFINSSSTSPWCTLHQRYFEFRFIIQTAAVFIILPMEIQIFRDNLQLNA